MIQDLSVTREEIDKVDSEIVRLIEQRMELALEVAKYKMSTGKPIYDRERELEKLEKLGDMASSEFNSMSVRDLFLQIMSVSRRYQYRVIGDKEHEIDAEFTCVDKLDYDNNTKVVYAGVPGAFAETALVSYFGENVQAINVRDFDDVARMIREEDAEYGVLPIENSTAGFVNGIYDMLDQNGLTIVAEQKVKVNQCLLGLPGTKLEEVKSVFSHPQGLLQAKSYLEQWDWKQVSVTNTAAAAKKVHQDGDKTQVAVAGQRAAQIYQLEILNPQLNESSQNTTRFVIVTKKKVFVKDANKITISFALNDQCGSLYNILAHFIFNDVNMKSIESVPLMGKQWEYCFFVDFEGNINDNDVKNALKGIKAETAEFKVLGCFESE